LTVEVRRTIEGSPQQCVIGRKAGSDDKRSADEIVAWDTYEAKVRPNEVFDAQEAGCLFVSYYVEAKVPPAYVLRPIVL
jgi:hypothetical protein